MFWYPHSTSSGRGKLGDLKVYRAMIEYGSWLLLYGTQLEVNQEFLIFV